MQLISGFKISRSDKPNRIETGVRFSGFGVRESDVVIIRKLTK